MLFSNKNKKLGSDLADLAIDLCADNKVLSFIDANDFSEAEKPRFLFGLSLVNFALGIFSINLFVKYDETKASKVLNPMLDHFSRRISKRKEDIHIGHFVVDPEELQVLNTNFEVSSNTRTNYFTLLDMVYDYRVPQYYESLENEFSRLSEDTAGRLGPMFPLTKIFYRHLFGRDATADKLKIILPLSLLIYSFFKMIVDCCKSRKVN